MRTRSSFLVLSLALAVMLGAASIVAGCGGAAATTTTTAPTTTSSTAGPGGAAPVRIVVPMSGAEVVPPVETAASGTFTLLVEGGPSPTGSFRVSYSLELADLADATTAHIHLGAKGTEGDVIVPLFSGPTKTGTFTGVLAEGAISESDLTGPMEGKKFQDLVGVVLAGQTYVNVHTTKYPNGEIRGQIIIPGASGSTSTDASGGEATTTSSSGGGY
jgi:CHRD domain